MFRPVPLQCLPWLAGSLVLAAACAAQPAWAEPKLLAALDEAVPQRAAQFSSAQVARLQAAAEALDRWATDDGLGSPVRSADEALARVARLTAAKQQVDRLLERCLGVRGEFANLPDDDTRRATARAFLQSATVGIDLSGRLRYLSRDVIDAATYQLADDPAHYRRLLDVLLRHESSIGAAVLTYLLFDPPPEEGVGAPPELKLQLLALIDRTRQADLLPELAEFARAPRTSPALTLVAVETIRNLGLPQDGRPGQPADTPPPVVTAGQLHARLASLAIGALSPAEQARRLELMKWLHERSEHGALGDSLRVAGFDLHVGDWLLMRNPSPYNRFTDLSPGLFTHVGVVAAETAADGRRRFVIVDLPERGEKIPATNVDAYLVRTLHYVFLRHRSSEAGQRMGAVAASVIGNPTQFDLLFRTSRVEQLKGEPLAGRRIHTYCAGFLLLCAQETDLPRDEFFPLAEQPISARCLDNLAQLGLSIGDDFISPTGALFSPRLDLVAWREPMYEPTREIKEAVYDHFAQQMAEGVLRPAPNAQQLLREKLAAMSKTSPWLARALAQANNVSEHLDLEAAAKAAAVIETLDEIADRAMNDFLTARQAVLTDESAPRGGRLDRQAREQSQRLAAYRQRHGELVARWRRGELSPRELRIELATHYIAQGRRQLDERFFRGE